jgi:hypothetical protein
MKPRTRNLLLNLFVLAVVCVICLLLAEAAVRVFVPKAANIHYESDPYRGFRFIPDYELIECRPPDFCITKRTNSRGLLDQEYPLLKPNGTYRIALFGGSQTVAAGTPNELTYHWLLEEKLNEHYKGNPRVEVINFGKGGSGTDDQLLELQHHALAFNPDLVLLDFSTTEYYDNVPANRTNQVDFALIDGELVQLPLNYEEWGSFKLWVGKHSRLAYYLYYTVLPSFTAQPDAAAQSDFFTPIYTGAPASAAQEEITFALVDRMRALSGAYDAEFLLFVMPEKENFDPATQQMLITQYDAHNLSMDFERPNRLILAHCAQANLSCVDLLSRMQAEPSPQDFYFRVDSHLSAEGHEYVSDVLFAEILARGVVR